MTNIKIGPLEVSIKKLKNTEPGKYSYGFSTTYLYIDYEGQSELNLLSFVDDLDAFFVDMNDKIKYDIKDENITLIIPVPYCSKVETILLHKEILNEHQHLIIAHRHLQDEIHTIKNEKLNDQYTSLYLMFSLENGFHFDTARWKKQAGANQANYDLWQSIMEDNFHISKDSPKLPITIRHQYDIPNKCVHLSDILKQMNNGGYVSIGSDSILSHNVFLCTNIIPGNYCTHEKIRVELNGQTYDLDKINRYEKYVLQNQGKGDILYYMGLLKKSAAELGTVKLLEWRIPNKTIAYKRIPGKYVNHGYNNSFQIDDEGVSDAIKKFLKKDIYVNYGYVYVNSHTYVYIK